MQNQINLNSLATEKRLKLARETLDPQMIEEFLDDEDSFVRAAAAANPAATAEVLVKYAKDRSPYVRAAAADNDNINNMQLLKLAAESYRIVREAAVANIRRRMRQGKI